MNFLISVLWLLCVAIVKGQYEIPDVLIEALSPKGLRVSIPDEDGISLFAFHGKINSKMNGREAGRFSVDIRASENGRWTFFDKNARLKIGDVLYYWVHVDYDDGGYEKDGEPFTIQNFVTETDTTNTTARPLCVHGFTKVNGKVDCKGILIFQEHFFNLDKKKWMPHVLFAQEPNFEFVMYKDDLKNVYVTDNNILHIKPTITEDEYGEGYVYKDLNLGSECTGLVQSLECELNPKAWIILPPVVSAQISTKQDFGFVYGIVEVRAKLPKGDWIYPEISLLPRRDIYGPGYDSGRIRIAFVQGNQALSQNLYAGCIMGNSEAARNYEMKKIHSDNQWTNDYHVYRVEWKPDGIVVSVDGAVFGTVYPHAGGFATDQVLLDVDPATAKRWEKGTKLAPFDEEMYITLGVGVGGQSFSDTIDNKPWENGDPKAMLNFYKNTSSWRTTWSADSELLVDYVKVWAV